MFLPHAQVAQPSKDWLPCGLHLNLAEAPFSFWCFSPSLTFFTRLKTFQLAGAYRKRFT
jgi:hypothetical protein